MNGRRALLVAVVVVVVVYSVGLVAASPSPVVRHGRPAGGWYRVARCETGGRWDWGAEHRPGEGDRYGGGVGFATSTWRLWAGQLGLLPRFPHAYNAPAVVQILVAQYGWEHGGYWGCLHGQ